MPTEVDRHGRSPAGQRHVGFVLPSLEVGGMEYFVLHLASELVTRRIRVSVYLTQRLGPLVSRALELGLAVHHVPLGSRWGNLFPRRLIAALRQDRPDVIHSQSGNWLAAAAAAIAVRKPLCHTEHGMEGDREPWKLALQKSIAFRLTDLTVAVSSSLQAPLARQLRATRESIRVVANGVVVGELEADNAHRKAVRGGLGMTAADIVVLCVARLHHLKGVDVLARACALLRPDTKIRVIVAGDGPDREMVDALSRSSSVPMELLGMRSDVAQLMRAADILVLPSRSEAMPLALLEGMAFALPVIVTSAGQMPEIVGSDAGLVVPREDPLALASAISRLGGDEALRREMGAAGRRRVEATFSLSAMAEAYLAIYQEIGMPRDSKVSSRAPDLASSARARRLD